MADRKNYSNKAFDAPLDNKAGRKAARQTRKTGYVTVEVVREYAGIMPGFRKTVDEESVRTRHMLDNGYWKIVSR